MSLLGPGGHHGQAALVLGRDEDKEPLYAPTRRIDLHVIICLLFACITVLLEQFVLAG